MNTEEFYKFPKELAKADGFISKITKEAVKLSSSAKIVYVYMLSRNAFFTESQQSSHYETQKTIAKACGIEYKAAGNILRSFLDHGVMTGKKLRPNGEGQWRWHYYKVFADIVLWEGTVDDYEVIKQEQRKQSESKPSYQPKPNARKTSLPVVEDEYDDLPF